MHLHKIFVCHRIPKGIRQFVIFVIEIQGREKINIFTVVSVVPVVVSVFFLSNRKVPFSNYEFRCLYTPFICL